MTYKQISLSVLQADNELGDAFLKAQCVLSRKGDGTFVHFPKRVKMPESARAYGYAPPNGGLILFGILPEAIEEIVEALRAARRAAEEWQQAAAEAEAEAEAREEALREARVALWRRLNLPRVLYAQTRLNEYLGDGLTVAGKVYRRESVTDFSVLIGNDCPSYGQYRTAPQIKGDQYSLDKSHCLYFGGETYEWTTAEVDRLVLAVNSWVVEGRRLDKQAIERLASIGLHKADVFQLDGRMIIRYNGQDRSDRIRRGEELIFGSFGSFAKSSGCHLVTINQTTWLVGGMAAKKAPTMSLGMGFISGFQARYDAHLSNNKYREWLEQFPLLHSVRLINTPEEYEEVCYLQKNQKGVVIDRDSGQVLWEGSIHELRLNYEACVQTLSTHLGAVMRATNCQDWLLAAALLGHEPVFFSEIVKAPELERESTSDTYRTGHYGFGGPQFRTSNHYYLKWTREVRRFGVRVGDCLYIYLASAETRKGSVSVDENHSLTDEVRVALDGLLLHTTEEAEWIPVGQYHHSLHQKPSQDAKDQLATYRQVIEVIELTRAVQAVSRGLD